MSSYTIWARITQCDYCRLRTFSDEILAEKYLAYVDRFCEIHPEMEIEDLYIKEDGLPVYQIYYLNPDGQEEILEDNEDLFFDFDEMIEELQEVSEHNPFSQFDYKEINLDDEDPKFIEIKDL